MLDTTIDSLAQVIWNYTKISEKLKKADVIIAMGSMDLRVAERAADLWLQGLAPVVVVTGGIGRLTGEDTTISEAAKFAEILHKRGLPQKAIIIEDNAKNGAENFTLSIAKLREQQQPASTVIAVTQPYMERRAFATGKKLFPDLHIQMASPELSYADYPDTTIPKSLMINIIVGELFRIQTYPEKGFTITQSIPLNVSDAARQLISQGYTTQLPKTA